MVKEYGDFSREDLERMGRRLRRIFGPWLTPDVDGDDLLQEALVVIMERGLWKYGGLEKLISSVARNLARNIFSSARREKTLSLERLMTEDPQDEEASEEPELPDGLVWRGLKADGRLAGAVRQALGPEGFELLMEVAELKAAGIRLSAAVTLTALQNGRSRKEIQELIRRAEAILHHNSPPRW